MVDPTSTDPWHKDNFRTTLDDLANQYRGHMAAFAGINGELKAKIARTLKTDDSNLPDYSLIDKTSEKFDQATLEAVIGVLRNAKDNDLNPLAKAYDPSKADTLSNAMVQQMYFGHIDRAIQSVGSPNFANTFDRLERGQQNQLHRMLESAAGTGYNQEMHGAGAVSALIDAFGAKKSLVNNALLKQNAGQLIASYVVGQTNSDELYAVAAKNPTS